MAVPRHSHPELEDRVTAEMALVRTEIAGVAARVDLLRQDTRGGFDTVRVLLAEQGETLREILEHLGRQGGGGDGTT